MINLGDWEFFSEGVSMKKKSIIFGIIFAIFIILAVIGIRLLQKKSYRLLKVYEFYGDGSVTREKKGDITPYANMVLESGDEIRLDKGKMCLQADEDKYIYLEEDTELKLVAEGNSEKGRTSIELRRGAITNDIQNKLSDESSYDINTPNSTMSVRGTIFRVNVYKIGNVTYTKVSVFEGKVTTRLVYKDGTVSDKEVEVEKGKEVIIFEDGTTTDYLSDPTDIDFDAIPDDVIGIVKDAKDDGRDVALMEGEVVTVTFMYNGTVFGTQKIAKGDKATVPSLAPAATGGWDWNFDKTIDEDVTIEWK